MKCFSFKLFSGIAAAMLIMLSGCWCEDDSGSVNSKPSVTFNDADEEAVYFIESGFLRGNSSKVESVEVSFDGGDYAAAVGTTEWTFPLPTGAVSWKAGSLHDVNLRGVLDDGSTTDAVTVTVRKGPNRDVNGDGYPELALGAYLYGYYDNGNVPVGRVYLFNGSPSGPGDSPSQTIESPDAAGITGFGRFIVLDDFNGDGYGDMAAADYNGSSYTGHVYIYYGSISGLAGSEGTTLTGTADSNFGWSLCSGDFDGNGYTDLAVGAPYGNGALYVFNGSSSGIDDCDLEGSGIADVSIPGGASDELGSSVISGDFNGDEYADLAAAASYSDTVSIFNGSIAGISTSADVVRTSVDNIDEYSANCLASGYINGDTCADLAVGAVYYSSSTGRVYVFHGSISGISETADPDVTLTGEYTTDYYGYSLSIADIDKDGYGDLAVGAPNFQNSSSGDEEYGAIYIYKGSSSGVEASYHTRYFEAAAEMDYLGRIVHFTDVNADGNMDMYGLAEGYIYEGDDDGDYFGRAYLYSGTSSGISFDDSWYFDAEFSVP